ncbi:hypothetical protein KEJ36_01130 [Candidatus Bathyarchaeota archaeon]|nr:hypothetical protein [Candidatus Bathyarchaeota archaeon]MBS7627426.1 hypothetical protein [Candidatus Bathyarchaeota archaeon]
MRPSKTLRTNGGQVELLDLFIKALEDHEKRLEEISQRLNEAIQSTKGIAMGRSRGFSSWKSFVKKVRGKARIVTYKLEDGWVTISALVGDKVRSYMEPLPSIRLQCPLEAIFSLSLDPAISREKLSQALEVPLENVMEAM